jgi:uncharacterized protein YjdB
MRKQFLHRAAVGTLVMGFALSMAACGAESPAEGTTTAGQTVTTAPPATEEPYWWMTETAPTETDAPTQGVPTTVRTTTRTTTTKTSTKTTTKPTTTKTTTTTTKKPSTAETTIPDYVATTTQTTATTTKPNTTTTTAPGTTLNVPGTGISLSPSNLTLRVGESAGLIAAVSPTNASNKNINFVSASSSVAAVSSAGVVTGRAAGTTTIYASLASNPSVSASITVTVTSTLVERITLSVSGSAQIKPGSTVQVLSTVYPADASNKLLRWSISGNGVTITQTGLVSVRPEAAYGTIYVTAEALDNSGVSTEASLLIVP